MSTTVRAVGELVARGWRWWIGELSELWSFGRRRARQRRSDFLLLDLADSRVTVSRCAEGRCEELGTVANSAAAKGAFSSLAGVVDPAVTPVVVRVAPKEVLTRSVSLPAAAAENLRQVLSYEMHRRTPFTADEVYFDYRPLAGGVGDPQIRVELSLVRRKLVDAALALLPPWDLRVTGVAHMPGLEAGGLLLELAPPVHEATSRRGLTRLLWVANVALLAAVVAVPFARHGRQMDELRVQVAAAKVQAEEAAALREKAEALRADRGFLIESKRDRPALVALLSELTAALPDTTWVQRLEVKSRQVRLRGTSATASALIPIIEDSPHFHNAVFNAPVTRNPVTGDEQFQLVFDITSPAGADKGNNGKNLQKGAGAIAAAGGLRRLR